MGNWGGGGEMKKGRGEMGGGLLPTNVHLNN